jgi:multidrug efflux pump subunit AcrA (membrane-fusion protein)
MTRRRRRLAFVVLLALGSATVGWAAGQGIRSPEEVARSASAPVASAITVPVERRALETTVVVRGDVTFARATEVSVDADLGDGTLTTQVVSGRVPRAGQRMTEGVVALEVSGRPVFLLAGPLPMYRGLRPGAKGNDVRQLESALRRLGLLGGAPDQAYDRRTEAAVTRLYRDAGYEPVGASAQERQEVLAAESQLAAARTTLREAEVQLADAGRPPARSTLLAAQSAVDDGRAAVDQAAADLAQARADGGDASTITALESNLRAARTRLTLVEAQLAELRTTPNTAVQRRAEADARELVEAAESALAEARRAVGVRIPRGEVVFVPRLPGRVDRVQVRAGTAPASPAFTLTAATVQVDSSVSLEERKLVTVGASAQLDDPASGLALTGAVTSVADTPGTNGAPPGSFHVRVIPDGANPSRLNGLNLRITIPIESTDGAVLVVPLAALVTNADGSVRVRSVPDGATGAGVAGDRFADVEVTAGLAANGFVEVTPVGGALSESDLVVVGQRQ